MTSRNKRYSAEEAARIISRLNDIQEDQSDFEDDPEPRQESSGDEDVQATLSDTSDSHESGDPKSAESNEENTLAAEEPLECTASPKKTGRGRGSRGRRGRPRTASRAIPTERNDTNAQGDVPGPSPNAGVNRQTPAGSVLNSLKIGDKVSGTDGSAWTLAEPGKELLMRRGSHNILRDKEGPSPYAKRYIETDDASSAWRLIVSESMLKHIQKCTVAFARESSGNEKWSISLHELDAFIAILYARGAYGARSLELESMWSKVWGPSFFARTMSRDRFREIMRYLRFDQKSDRLARLQNDKFALISEVWKKFVENCQACYIPGANLTGDEQLFPCKCRCRFIQYMPNKPDKFGIKFWILAESESKYMCNASPYLGKVEERGADESLGEHVIMNLAQPFLNKGRNITTDNFFTSTRLANRLKNKGTSLVGTVNRARREIPKIVKQSKAPLYSTVLLTSAEASLTVYQGKVTKNVLILSTMHPSIQISEGQKKLPETVEYYNKTKAGVDSLDQMARKYSTRAGTRRWPVHVFYNILDLAAINAWILFKKCTDSNISRRDFLLKLATELSQAYTLERGKAPINLEPEEPTSAQSSLTFDKRRKCSVLKGCQGNKTSVACATCKKPVCGKCSSETVVYCLSCKEK